MQADLLSFLSGANAPFIAELYERFLRNPADVDPEWAEFFRGLSEDAEQVLAELRGASWAPRKNGIIGAGEARVAKPANGAAAANGAVSLEQLRAATVDSIRALMLIRAYRVRGHLEAKLD